MPEDSRGVDVDVIVTLPGGRVVEGEVTLVPREDGLPEYDSWGDPDDWVSGELLAELRREYPDRMDYRKALCELCAVASRAAGRVPEVQS